MLLSSYVLPQLLKGIEAAVLTETLVKELLVIACKMTQLWLALRSA